MNKIDFPAWLQNELNNRGWRPTDLAKRTRLSDAAISRILRGERSGDSETLIAIAHAFNISPIAIFRTAGLLPDNGSDQIKFDDWQYLLSQMTDDEQEEIRQIIEMKIERRKKREGVKTLKPRKAG